MYASALAIAAGMPPAAVTWLSLIIIMSYNPMRWLWPPPVCVSVCVRVCVCVGQSASLKQLQSSKYLLRHHSPTNIPINTAHLSSMRRPGAVLRVSKIFELLASLTMAAVAVAMPLIRCVKKDDGQIVLECVRPYVLVLPCLQMSIVKMNLKHFCIHGPMKQCPGQSMNVLSHPISF